MPALLLLSITYGRVFAEDLRHIDSSQSQRQSILAARDHPEASSRDREGLGRNGDGKTDIISRIYEAEMIRRKFRSR